MGPMSYEGPENYIFISYAHKDSEKVLYVLEKLVERGYRIWYDDGLAPGSEWPEDIAEHLDKCAVFMSFISNNSMESPNCRREINFALSRQKPFLGIMLEPTKMTLGMEMQLSSQHCLVWDNYREEKDFLRKLLSSPDLECCKEAAEAPEVPAAPKPAAKLAQAAAPVKKTEEKPRKEPKPKKEKKPKKADGTKKKSLPRRLLEGTLIVAVLAALVAVGMVVGSYVTVLPEVRTSRYTTTLTLREQNITVDAVKKLNTLEKMTSLYLYDCTVDEGAFDWLSSETLRSLHAENTPVTDLTFLNNCPAVNRLTLENCSVTDKAFDGVDMSRVEYLELPDNPKFTELTVITCETLRSVNVDGTGVSSIEHLASFPRLNEVDCSRTAVTSLEALAELQNLTVLRASECSIGKITKPFLSLSMHTLELNGCELKTIEGFENFTVLKKVYLSGNKLKELDWLAKSVATLTDVNLSGNELDKDAVWFLKDAISLSYLDVSGITLTDGALFEKMTDLSTLYAAHCGLESLAHMDQLGNIRELYLSHNKLQDLTGIPPFAQLGYSRLDLAYNNITSVAPIAGGQFSVLALQGNPIELAEGDFSDLGGSLLALDYHESMLDSGKLNFSRTYITGCPGDKQLALQDAVGYGLACVTEDLLLEALEKSDVYY